ncbi:MAG: protein kinase [Blastocatellia bacterium]|nr:protein kinase [Blastocatellia bacterium]
MSEINDAEKVGHPAAQGPLSAVAAGQTTISNTPPTSAQPTGSSGVMGSGDLVGQTLAEKYKIHHLLGQGGAGEVYYATQLGLDRPVALKVLRSDVVCDVVSIERFRREARAAARLQHPNVVSVYDFGTLPEVCAYIAMEYLPGRTLREEIRQNPSGLEVMQAITIFKQVCDGVHAAHEHGIIHRDLKPQNIFLETGTGGAFRAKVLDFGIAKTLEFTTEGTSDLTGSMLVGTPHYCSPEQCMGEPLDPRSDVYSLGVVLFQMLTGRFPIDGEKPSALIVKHVTTPPHRLRDFRPDLPVSLERVVGRALEKRPSDRPTTALDFISLIEAALRDEDTFVTAVSELFRRGSGETKPPVPSQTVERVSVIDDDTPTLMQTTTVGAATPAPPPPVARGKTAALPADMSSGKRRLAVLPLRNVARAQDIDFLSFSLADAVIMQLAYVKSLIVRPSSAIVGFHEVVDLGAVSKSLDVDTILTGMFLRAGETIRVSVQLVDVAPNEILWREQFDLPFGDILVLQDRIAEKIVEGLKLTISSHELELIRRDVPKDALAYELFLRAKNCDSSVAETQTALELLHRSLELDGRYAPAWAELAGRHLHLAVEGLAGKSHLEESRKAAEKALTINPELPEAHAVLMGAYAQTGHIEEALNTCFKLLEIAPSNEFTHLGLGHVYEYSGLIDQALRSYTRSLQINPKLMEPYSHIAALYAIRGEYKQAEAFLTDSVCGDIQCRTKAYLLGLFAMRRGDTAEAVRHFRHSEEWSPNSLWGLLSRSLRLRIEGQVAASFEILDHIRGAICAGDRCFFLAHHYVTGERLDDALDLLECAVDKGYCNVAGYEANPAFEPLRSFPRFQALVERAKAQKAEFAECVAELHKLETNPSATI